MKVQISAHEKRNNVSVLTYYSAGKTLSAAEHALLQACLGPCKPRQEAEFAVITHDVLNRDLPARVKALVAHGFTMEIR